MGAPAFELRLLGNVDLVDQGGNRIDEIVRQPKRLALLAYLCIEGPGGFHPRDRLLALFWPERPDKAARGALNQALYALRGALAVEAIVSVGPTGIGVSPEMVSCDATRLLSVIAESAGRLTEDGKRRLEDALTLYQGELLDGVYPPGADGFMEWLDRSRMRIQQEVTAAHRKLAHLYQTEGEVASFLTHAQRAAELNPFNEATHRHLLEAYLAIDDRGGALRAHHEYTERLTEAFGSGPSEETVEWVETLLARHPDRVLVPVEVEAPPWLSAGEDEGARPGESAPVRWGAGVVLGLVVTIAAVFGIVRSGEPPPGSVLLTTDGTAQSEALARALLASGPSSATSDFTLVVEPPRGAGVAAWLESWAVGPAAGSLLRLSTDREGDSIRVEVSALRGLPGRLLVQLRSRVPSGAAEMATLTDRILGMLTVQFSDDPFPWKEVVGRSPRYSAIQSFREGIDAFEDRDRDRGRRALREAIRRDPDFLLAWFELATRDWGTSVRDWMVEVPDGGETLRLEIWNGLSEERALSEVERHHVTALTERQSRARSFPHWRAAALVAPKLYAERAASVAAAMGAYDEVLAIVDRLEMPPPTQSPESVRLLTLWQIIALHAAGRYREQWDVVKASIELHSEQSHLANHAVAALSGIGDEQSLDEIRAMMARRMSDTYGPLRAVVLAVSAVDELNAHGHGDAAEELFAEFMASIRASAHDNSALMHEWYPDLLIREGNLDEAERVVRSFLEDAPEGMVNGPIDNRVTLGRILALKGDRDGALAIAVGIEAAVEEGEISAWGAAEARASILGALGNQDEADRLTEEALSLGMPHWYLSGGAPHM